MSRNRGAGFGRGQAAPSGAAGTLLAAPDRTSTWSPAGLAREAFALTFRGSRRDLEEVSARRTQATLLFLVLAARAFILAQAGIDLAVGNGVYPAPAAVDWRSRALRNRCYARWSRCGRAADPRGAAG